MMPLFIIKVTSMCLANTEVSNIGTASVSATNVKKKHGLGKQL